MRLGILNVLGWTLLWSCQTRPVFDINSIVNKTPYEVEAILGTPDTSYTQRIVTKDIFTQIYSAGCEVEIMYPNGLSTDVVILNGSPQFAFEASTITKFGLEEIPPSEVLPNAFIKWKNYPGYTTINFFATDLDSTGSVAQFNLFFKTELGRTRRNN
jgi:hypothetical protein